ncbi:MULTISPECIES: type VI secretion system tube protein TssD [Pseudotamlana]|uniref:Type VI secretion system needle protein Hcp n=1 Tax=Pseudotamlana carrageenivorans TaxID=2069432 RepID=A0A2I7SMA0_9FLAO|nr:MULTISPECIES: type VI secretion system tube protein TssD [Tamlana]AUS07035.1 hypothetical protein C1A40_16995 [Tamlana carrageenivorans]
MSFLSKLSIEGDEMNVLDCAFEFSQQADYNGRPAENPRGGQIQLLVESTSKTDFMDWAISPEMVKNGTITFYKRENMASLKKIEFKNAYCLRYHEHFNAHDTEPMQTLLMISAHEITIKGTTFSNNWPIK